MLEPFQARILTLLKPMMNTIGPYIVSIQVERWMRRRACGNRQLCYLVGSSFGVSQSREKVGLLEEDAIGSLMSAVQQTSVLAGNPFADLGRNG